MKKKMIRMFSLLGVGVAMALSVTAQEPKLKTTDTKDKYKSEDLKVKVKDGDKDKVKSTDLKEKDVANKSKIKGRVVPMHRTMREETELKTGETQVKTKVQIEPVAVETTTPEPIELPDAQPAEVPAWAASAPKHHIYHKSAAAHKSTVPHKYIVRTKVVRDTVYVPSAPERVVSTETQYLHDTVDITRVDTFVKVQTENTYSGYAVPRGDFKKVKLIRDKSNGDVWMKRKAKDNKVTTEKLKEE